jgi:hypothetical protein
MGYYLNRRQDEQYHRKFSNEVDFEADIVGNMETLISQANLSLLLKHQVHLSRKCCQT